MRREVNWLGVAGVAVGLMIAPSVFAQDWELAPADDASAISPQEPVAPSPAAEMQQIQMQLQQISAQLGTIQRQAFELQEVLDAFSSYEEKLRAKMVELAPEAEADIIDAEALMEELRAVNNPADLSPEEAQQFQEKYMEFQMAVQRLQPLEQQAILDPDIQAAQGELETVVQDAMSEIAPEAPAIITQREQLIERYLELEQQQMQQQQGQEPPVLNFPEM